MPAICPKIFISYRRDDTGHAVDRLSDALSEAYGAEAVFLDTDSIEIGRRFDTQIDQALVAARVLLLAIGPRFGGRRLHNSQDWVRKEIIRSIRLKKPVIPLLIDDGELPNALPRELAALPSYQSFPLRRETWRDNVTALIKLLERSGLKRIPSRRTRAHAESPGVVLMDSPLKIYDRKPILGAMNSHVIRRRLRGLALGAINIEPVYPGWDDWDVVSSKEPDLIIIHYSCLDATDTPKNLRGFLSDALRGSKTAKAIVYSRTNKASAFDGRIEYVAKGFKHRVFGLPIHKYPKRPQSFDDPETAAALRALVKCVLDL
jgi:hypothetical protein